MTQDGGGDKARRATGAVTGAATETETGAATGTASAGIGRNVAADAGTDIVTDTAMDAVKAGAKDSAPGVATGAGAGGPAGRAAAYSAFILAAGMGTRLRPYTDTAPKPLVPVAGRPIIDYVLERLAAAGIRHVAANLHYRGDQLAAHLTAYGATAGAARPEMDVRLVREDVLLDTGGGIRHAMPYLVRGPAGDDAWEEKTPGARPAAAGPCRATGRDDAGGAAAGGGLGVACPSPGPSAGSVSPNPAPNPAPSLLPRPLPGSLPSSGAGSRASGGDPAPVPDSMDAAGDGHHFIRGCAPDAVPASARAPASVSALVPDAPFFVAAGDSIWTDPPGGVMALDRMAAAWDGGRMDMLILLQPLSRMILTAGRGDYDLRPDGRAVRAPDKDGAYMWTSVRLCHPRLFADTPDGPFSFLTLLDRAQAAGRLYGIVHEGDWHHISTPADLEQVDAALRAEGLS